MSGIIRRRSIDRLLSVLTGLFSPGTVALTRVTYNSDAGKDLSHLTGVSDGRKSFR